MFEVSRISYLEPTLVGTIDEDSLTFTYDAAYLHSSEFVAEDLVEDMRPRLAVLRRFCG